MADGELYKEEPSERVAGLPGRASPWRERARDWKQLLLIVITVAGIIVVWIWATRPPAPLRIDPVHKRIADRFVGALVVQHNCREARGLIRPDGFFLRPFPKSATASSRSCETYAYYLLNREHWWLVRHSGAIIPNCAFRGTLASRYLLGSASGVGGAHDDDCVAYRLIARKPDRYNKSFIYFLGYLIVHPSPKHKVWKVDGVEAYASYEFDEGTCPAYCRTLLAHRALPDEPAT